MHTCYFITASLCQTKQNSQIRQQEFKVKIKRKICVFGLTAADIKATCRLSRVWEGIKDVIPGGGQAVRTQGDSGELTGHVGTPLTGQERLNREGWAQGLMGNAETDSCVIHVGSDVAEWMPYQRTPTREAERQGNPRMSQF